jgi:hypothetical protein
VVLVLLSPNRLSLARLVTLIQSPMRFGGGQGLRKRNTSSLSVETSDDVTVQNEFEMEQVFSQYIHTCQTYRYIHINVCVSHHCHGVSETHFQKKNLNFWGLPWNTHRNTVRQSRSEGRLGCVPRPHDSVYSSHNMNQSCLSRLQYTDFPTGDWVRENPSLSSLSVITSLLVFFPPIFWGIL